MEDDFKTISEYKGYVSKPEITAIGPQFLVKGSKNCLIDYALRVISRAGYVLYNQANTGAGPIVSSYDWATSNGAFYQMRSHDDKLEFDFGEKYNTLKSGFATPKMEFAKIWDNVEKIDMLMMVNGDTNVYKWSGGVETLRASTATTLQKQGVITAATTIAFVGGTPGTVAPTITDSNGNFLNAGFAQGDSLYVSGSFFNNRIFTIGSVTAGVITLIMSNVVTSEVAGNAITIHNGSPTWATSRFIVNNTQSTIPNPVTISIATPAVITYPAHGLMAGDIVQFTTTGTLPTNLALTTNYYVISAGLTPSAFQVATTLGGSAIATSGTQSGVQGIVKTQQRSITYKGVSYPYTGGETTDTLTGLVGFPAIALGDMAFQTMITLPNPAAIPAYFTQDLIGVQLNQLILASTKSQSVYGSSTADYTNFALTSPRVPGDPWTVTMDKSATCIVPIDNVAQTTSSIMFGGGTNEFFQLSFQLSQDNANEIVRMIKLKTAAGSGLISKDAITPVKTGTAYISHEPALDILSQVENADRKDLPLSDAIKDDFDQYNFTDADVKYWKRAIYVALPSEGIFLIYDLMRNLWHPPQFAPVSRWAIIDDWLYGHSSITNETYKMFTGLNDNGNFIPVVARFGYNNGGRRDRLKNTSEYWTDGYMTTNAIVNMTQYLGFEGAKAIKTLLIMGNDPDITVSNDTASPPGSEPLGVVPLGGASFGVPIGLAGAVKEMVRYYQIDTMDVVDYFEQFVEYTMNVIDAQFAVVAHGSNQWDSGTSPVSNKK